MNEPWLAHYDAAVPKSIGTYPDQTMAGLAQEYARTRPDATAVSFKGRRLTHAEIEKEAAAFAAGLAKLGVAAGDRVAILLGAEACAIDLCVIAVDGPAQAACGE